jgi:hypothetical protein
MYNYEICGCMNVETKVRYTKSNIQQEIRAKMETGTSEQMDANLAALEKDIAEILRVSKEQKVLLEAYEHSFCMVRFLKTYKNENGL